MRHLKDIYQGKNIPFDAINSHIHCIAHIMNLAIQDILKHIKADETQTEDDILNNMDANVTGEVILKVYCYFIIYHLDFDIVIIILIYYYI